MCKNKGAIIAGIVGGTVAAGAIGIGIYIARNHALMNALINTDDDSVHYEPLDDFFVANECNLKKLGAKLREHANNTVSGINSAITNIKNKIEEV